MKAFNSWEHIFYFYFCGSFDKPLEMGSLSLFRFCYNIWICDKIVAVVKYSEILLVLKPHPCSHNSAKSILTWTFVLLTNLHLTSQGLRPSPLYFKSPILFLKMSHLKPFINSLQLLLTISPSQPNFKIFVTLLLRINPWFFSCVALNHG